MFLPADGSKMPDVTAEIAFQRLPVMGTPCCEDLWRGLELWMGFPAAVRVVVQFAACVADGRRPFPWQRHCEGEDEGAGVEHRVMDRKEYEGSQSPLRSALQYSELQC